MIVRSKNRKRAPEMIYLLTGLFVLIAAAVFVLSMTNTALSRGFLQGEKGALKGEVVAFDNSHHLKTLTVQSDEIGPYPNDTLHVYLNKNTSVKVCKMPEPAKDIALNRNAAIMFHEVAGLAVADSISEKC